jgi:glycosyltransferase involved in cell wall biosynthesis
LSPVCINRKSKYCFVESKFVSIIIPVYRDWNRLSRCLNALQKQTYPRHMFEVIVINNDLEDNAPLNFLLAENHKLIVEEKPGSYAARNTGLKVAKGEIIGFTDSDCVPNEDWIENAVNYLLNNPTCSRVGGNILIFNKSSKPTLVESYNNVYSFPQKWHINKRGTSVTANLFTYKYVFEKVGLFDEKLMSMGDSKWAKQAGKAGYKLHYVENVIVRHPARTLSELIKKERRLGGAEGTFKKDSSNKIKNLNVYKFLRSFKPQKKEFEFLAYQGKGLSIVTKFSLFALKYYLEIVRAFERLRVQMGKKPNRA